MSQESNEILEKAHIEITELLQTKEITDFVDYLESNETPDIAGASLIPPTIKDAITTIVENIPSNKYIFSIVITSCIKKICNPKQDIRIAQDNMDGGYSNRSLDQRVITPFLKRYGYTHCEASGLESGRNLERPLPWDLEYQCNPRGRGNRESFLAILDFIQTKKGDPWKVMLYMLYLDLEAKDISEAVQKAPIENNINQIMNVFNRHFAESSGQGKSRLPVLALYSIYESLMGELGRYKDTTLLPLERHTTADLRSGSIGDIQINKDDEPFEGIEVKSEKPVTAAMVNELQRKFTEKPISRYYILSTFPGSFKEEDVESIKKAVEQTQNTTGCQIIVNGLNRTIWYYLRLLTDPSNVLSRYVVHLNADADVRPALIEKWNQIIEEEYND